ncbi:hypothetical protein SO802_028686 [Lithocarpus litseifolius]|uniref:Peptidase A2 domain-containing protein n=1 Tax=Lithocarpus litseifolius TaxID=425828 RepID=A0AAW2BT70_9ROSI
MGHMSMVAITYMNNHSLDHPEIVELLSTGFSGTLRGWWDSYLTEDSRESIKRAVKMNDDGFPIFYEKRNSGIPDGVNTLVYTILKHFVGTLTNVSSRVSDYLNNLRCLTMSDYRWYQAVFLSRVMLRKDCKRPYWKENFIDGLPPIFAHKIQNPKLQKEYLDKFKKNLTKNEDSKKLKSTISFEETLERFNKKKPKELTINELQHELNIVKQKIVNLEDEYRIIKSDNDNIKQELLILKLDKTLDKQHSDNEQDELKQRDVSSQQALLSDTGIADAINSLDKTVPPKWFTKVNIVVSHDYNFDVIAMIDSGADMNCIQEGLIPSKYFEMSTERLVSANGSQMKINYELTNAHVSHNNVSFKIPSVLVRNMHDKVILGLPFLNTLYPFLVDHDGITSDPFKQRVKFKFVSKFEIDIDHTIDSYHVAESSLRILATAENTTNTISKWIKAIRTTSKWNIMSSSASRKNKGKAPVQDYPQDKRIPAGQSFVMHEEVTFSSGDIEITLQEVISKILQFHNGNFSDLPTPVKVLLDNLQAAYIINHRKLFKKTLQALEIHLVNLTAQNEVYEGLIVDLSSKNNKPVNQPFPQNEAFVSHSIHHNLYTSLLFGKEEIHSVDKMTLMGTDYAKLSLKTQFGLRCVVANLPSDIQKSILENKAMFRSFDLWYEYFKKLVTASILDPDELDVDDNVFIQLDWEEYFGKSSRVYERKIHPFPGLLINYEDDELDEEDMDPD